MKRNFCQRLAIAAGMCIVLAGCSGAAREVTMHPKVGSLHPTTDDQQVLARSAAVSFDGNWSFASDCNFGHYVTLGLSQSGNTVTGDWSDGTRVRGSQGNLRGEIHNGELIAQRCDDGSDVGGQPDCPAFEAPHDSFVHEGDSVVWYQTYDGQRIRYVVLHPLSSVQSREQGCEDNQDDGDQG